MISFVIPAHNEQELIGRTIRALQAGAQALREPYEIIVVNDASTDRTAQISADLGAQVVTVQLRQISAVRNAGARRACGEVFFFVDADTLVPVDTLRAALRALAHGAVGGGAMAHFDGRVPLYALVLLEIVFGIAFRVFRLTGGCFLFCTRAAFQAAGGFDERLFATEELALSQALKRQGRFVVLRQCVITSGRKLRAYSASEILGLLFRIGLRGPMAVRSRNPLLDIWYAERRPDPQQEC